VLWAAEGAIVDVKRSKTVDCAIEPAAESVDALLVVPAIDRIVVEIEKSEVMLGGAERLVVNVETSEPVG